MLIQADARQIPLADESVQCVVTSPPYWGLRDYGTATWIGGDEACDHLQSRGGHLRDSVHTTRGVAKKMEEAQRVPFKGTCGKCGARRVDLQIGLEATPDEYVSKMVEVFREVRRVLKKDGTCWLNLGDSYCGSWGNYGGQNRGNGTQRAINTGSQAPNPAYDGLESWRPPTTDIPGLKPKDLVGIPWRVAFALQADGWYLRSDIIWHKPNPMPESVTDRPTKAHEYLFLLSKSPRYYFDADAVREAGTMHSADWNDDGTQKRNSHVRGDFTGKNLLPGKEAFRTITANRNIRSVWTIATQPYSGAHFATFPEKLVEPCILAGSRPGDLVFDPFVGSGTVIRVATRHRRRGVGCEINLGYLGKQAKKRMSKVQVEMAF